MWVVCVCPLYRDGTNLLSLLCQEIPNGRKLFYCRKAIVLPEYRDAFQYQEINHHLTFQHGRIRHFSYRTVTGNLNISSIYPAAGWYSIDPNIRQRKYIQHITFQHARIRHFSYGTVAGNLNISCIFPAAGWYSIDPNIRQRKYIQHITFQYGISVKGFL